jgi:hypothetical protein
MTTSDIRTALPPAVQAESAWSKRLFPLSEVRPDYAEPKRTRISRGADFDGYTA